ncbi:MAG: LmbU family transcriptional regulator [Verrucomicrobiota bacterium]
MNTLAISDPKFAITPTGIEFSEELSFDEWDALGQKLAPVGKSIGFIIGDWINYGENHWGERYKDALERTGLAYQTLAQYSYVARKVQFSCRQEKLGFEHHLVVAKIKDSEEQRYWLDMAVKHKLGKRRLRKSINFGRLATEQEVAGDPHDKRHTTYLSLLNKIRRWWQEQTETAPVDDWDDERRQALKDDFEFVKDIYEAL